MNRNRIIDKVVGIEGGYSNHPNDSGGETMYGITKAVAEDFGYTGEMSELPIETARQIYKMRYWDSLLLNDVMGFSCDLAYELFEYGVNAGIGRAGIALQRALNAFNNNEAHYADLFVDGIVGPKTINALGSFYDQRGEEGAKVLASTVNAIQCNHYLQLSEANPEKYEVFTYGWILHRGMLEG